jgi:hypothetical protein
MRCADDEVERDHVHLGVFDKSASNNDYDNDVV